ncbi:3355_t:CDS:1, partial [Rhizophagus irregularis]
MDKGIGVPSDEKIVNMIQAWRLKEKEEKGSDNGDEDSEDGLGLSCLEKSASEPLK